MNNATSRLRHVGRGALLASSVSALALLQAPAYAADAAARSDNGQVQEVIVTANRSGAESLQRLAMAISAVNTDQLAKNGQGSLLDLTKFSPSLSITESAPGQNKFDMRGLSTGGYALSDTSDRSLVAVYLDDTPISVQGQTPDLKVFDLERVEILRGPQGTLYGAGSMAGTIRFITAKPNSRAMFGSAEATGSGTEHGSASYSLRGTINIPLITDRLAVRAAVYQAQDGGYIDNIGGYAKSDANRNQTTQARVALRWTPNAKLTLDASFTYERSHAFGLNTGFSGLAPYTKSTNAPEGTHDDFNMLAVNGSYDLGFADLVSSTSYTWRRIGYRSSIESTIGYFFQDYLGLPTSATAYPLYNLPTAYDQRVTNSIPPENFLITNKVHNFMQEVRLVSKGEGPIKWTVGVFYEHQRRNLYQDIPTPGFDRLSYENVFFGPFNTVDGLYNSKTVDGAFNADDIFSGLQNMTEHQIALFTDDTWHVTKKLDLTAGVRYFNFKENYFLFEGGVYGVANHVPLTQYATQASHGFNPRFNVAYHVDDDITVYAEIAKGFRYGGANQPVPIGDSGIAGQCKQNLASYGYTAAPLTFGPDKLWSYSIGEKAKLAGGRMTLNADAYWIDWSDVQTRLGLNCSYFFTDNKGKIKSRGVEVTSILRVTPQLTVSGNASYNDSRANGDIFTAGAFNGDLAPYFPRWIASVSVFYDRPVAQGVLHLQAGYQYRGDEQNTFNPVSTYYANGKLNLLLDGAGKSVANPSFAVIPASNNVNASVAYNIGRYELGVFGNNLTNGVKVTDITKATYYAIYQAGDFVTYARPRTIGARVKVTF